MFVIDSIILLFGVLILVAIASSRFAARLGMPALVIFIAAGMLAGSEGIGHVAFEDYELAHAVGTVALVVILFDGGLGTSYASFRAVWRPAAALATGGVVVTAGITGAVSAWILDLSLLEGLLLGAIAGSTDAAAVFAVFRGTGLNVAPRITHTLEVESGANDPMAIFLTVGLLEMIVGRKEFGFELVGMFVLQMGVGALVGWGVGRGAVVLVNGLNLAAAGLYPVLASAAALLAFGLASNLSGSGFLAVYLAGIILGNNRLVFKRGILLFHDGMAWLSQLIMFIVLGLLSFPSRLVEAAPAGLLVTAILIFVARPISVFGLLAPFGFNRRELAFISWSGLKGAVPIILGIYPLLYGLPGGAIIFDSIFFVVLISAIMQGSTLGHVARFLGLLRPAQAPLPISLDITSIKQVDGDIVGYAVLPENRLVGRVVRDLALPDGALVALITRGDTVIPPRGSTRIEAADHLFVAMHQDLRPVVDRLFSGAGSLDLPKGGVDLQGSARIDDLAAHYDLLLTSGKSSPDATLEDLVRSQLAVDLKEVVVGAEIGCGEYMLEILELRDGRVKRVHVGRRKDRV